MIPDFASALSNPIPFQIVTNNQAVILKDSILSSSDDISKDVLLEISYCCDANNNIQLSVNDQLIPLSGSFDSFMWSKKIIPLSADTKDITIKIIGPSGTFVVFGKINLYQ